MWKGFRDFLFRGNVVDLAVAVVIGTAFTAVVDGFTASFIDPLLALILGGTGVDSLATLTLGPFPIGLFVSALINFILKAAVIYFFVVRPFASIAAKFAASAAPTEDVVLLREIRDLLKQQGTPR
jgi:large conductance mechanosensitive channel